MATIQKCDECGALGQPGDTWVTVSVLPQYLRGNERYYSDEVEVSPGRLGGNAAVCSPACAIKRLRQGLLDLSDYANSMLEAIDESLLEDQARAVSGHVTDSLRRKIRSEP
jgi:Na+/phosphate symporter